VRSDRKKAARKLPEKRAFRAFPTKNAPAARTPEHTLCRTGLATRLAGIRRRDAAPESEHPPPFAAAALPGFVPANRLRIRRGAKRFSMPHAAKRERSAADEVLLFLKRKTL
jgi:hypothetical protein